jgi:Asp/Glu/hydantoin racemase
MFEKTFRISEPARPNSADLPNTRNTLDETASRRVNWLIHVSFNGRLLPGKANLALASTLALLHTSPTLTPLFTSLCRKHLPQTEIFHMVDESLIQQTIAVGKLQKVTVRRLIGMIESAASIGVDGVLVTCSSIGPATTIAARLFPFPVIRVDDAMAEKAVNQGRRIGVLATLRTTLEPTTALLREKSAAAGTSTQIEESLCEGAFEAVLAGDTETHDRMVSQALTDLVAKVDLVVLAQASMARVLQQMPELTVPVLSSPELAVLRTRELLNGHSQALPSSAHTLEF